MKSIPRLGIEASKDILGEPLQKALVVVMLVNGTAREEPPEEITQLRDEEYENLQEAIRCGNEQLCELERNRVLRKKS